MVSELVVFVLLYFVLVAHHHRLLLLRPVDDRLCQDTGQLRDPAMWTQGQRTRDTRQSVCILPARPEGSRAMLLCQGAATHIDAVLSAATGVTMRSQGHGSQRFQR